MSENDLKGIVYSYALIPRRPPGWYQDIYFAEFDTVSNLEKELELRRDEDGQTGTYRKRNPARISGVH